MRSFSSKLQAWYLRNHRDLPWRRTHHPYRIWISEIMLQQTRAEVVIPYYKKFLKRFPSLADLAEASEADVLACWSGLGYYTRARNLLNSARRIVAEGRFPDRYETIRQLPGVGDSTAASIASIAFGLPHAVLDGNVKRVISRLTNDAADIGAARTKSRFRETAQKLLDPTNPGRFNQAMMELGATVCLARAPRCAVCPVASHCQGRLYGTVNQLPVKLPAAAPKHIAATVVIAQRSGKILLWRRGPQAARMAGFWELPAPEQLPSMKNGRILGSFRHSITHHRYTFTVMTGEVLRAPAAFRWISSRQLENLPVSTITRKALKFNFG